VLGDVSSIENAAYLTSVPFYRNRRLDREWKASKRTGAGVACLCANALSIEIDDGIQHRVQTLNLANIFVRQLQRGDFALLKQRKLCDGWQKCDVHLSNVDGLLGKVERRIIFQHSLLSAFMD
jgi:hypothetical protein